MKKIFIISSIFLMAILFFLGVYNFAFKKNKTQDIEKQGVETKQLSDSAASNNSKALSIQKIYPITEQNVIGAAYDKKTDSLLYYSQDGLMWKVNSDGKNKQQLSKEKIIGLKNATWSPNRNKVIITSDSQGKNIFTVYDIDEQKSLQLKDGLDTVSWDNVSSKIIYKYFDEKSKERTLNIANSDGSNWQKLTDITFRNLSVAQVPLTSIISFWNSGNANEETTLQTIGISDNQPKTIFKGRFGADYLWSPNGSTALISSLTVNNKVTLGTIDLNGSYTELNVPTFISKCVWSSDNKTVYYALAGGINGGVVVPNDYTDGKVSTKDTFWKMDITTGKKERLLDPSEATETYDASNMFLSSTEDALYFINKTDKKLYKIEI